MPVPEKVHSRPGTVFHPLVPGAGCHGAPVQPVRIAASSFCSGTIGSKLLSYTGCHTARWTYSGLRWMRRSCVFASGAPVKTSPSTSRNVSFGRPTMRLM